MSTSRVLIYIVSLIFMVTPVTVRAQHAITDFTIPITCVDVTLPITFSWINYNVSPAEVPEPVQEKIKSIVADFCIESNGGDSSEITNAENYYFNTLRTRFNNTQLYIVILRTASFQHSHCKLLLYDSTHVTVSAKAVDYNTGAMYAVDENRMKRSELFKSFHIESDDILLPKSKQPVLLVKRLKDKGVYTDLEEITYRANGVSLDTVSYKKTPL